MILRKNVSQLYMTMSYVMIERPCNMGHTQWKILYFIPFVTFFKAEPGLYNKETPHQQWHTGHKVQ